MQYLSLCYYIQIWCFLSEVKISQSQQPSKNPPKNHVKMFEKKGWKLHNSVRKTKNNFEIFYFVLFYTLIMHNVLYFQPYVTFGVYEKKRKIILVWICFASVIFLFIGLLLLFYVTPIHDCEVCKYFNCIPITKDFCADQNINLDSEVW